MRGNHTNNYIERSFGIMKNIIFARTQAYNPVQVFQFITMNMERFYERRLLGVAHKHPGTLCIANANEFLVPSTKNNELIYVVNSEIGVCTCPIGMSGTPCKHQGAVSMKFHISIFNFIPSLTPDDRMIYAYIALGYVAEDKSFYASLHAQTALQNQEIVRSEIGISNKTLITGWRGAEELSELSEETKNLGLILLSLLHIVIMQNLSPIIRLSSYLYDLNRNIDPMVAIKSGAHIRVQVESIKRRKTEESSAKRKLLVPNMKKKKIWTLKLFLSEKRRNWVKRT
ncbi:hypothetical protein RhiirC2_796476 [Rhizophagus irregularis]|uniref:SWIM-type domain-containing protein n=1 Tax=Rhizophagus irregularis TaxID=588596 RepID=A0A2N1M9P1_9GLOM|nr:hypothetical protein RhiirC2_796476 [Rhizophagus irregularis]